MQRRPRYERKRKRKGEKNRPMEFRSMRVHRVALIRYGTAACAMYVDSEGWWFERLIVVAAVGQRGLLEQIYPRGDGGVLRRRVNAMEVRREAGEGEKGKEGGRLVAKVHVVPAGSNESRACHGPHGGVCVCVCVGQPCPTFRQ